MFKGIWTLVVEDDAHSLIAIGVILKELGIDFKRNTTGSGVVEQIKEMQPRPSFILLNLSLPDGDPFATVNELRSNPELFHIPVIAIGTETSNEMFSRLEHAGFSGFIPKPLPRKRFPLLIRRFLKGEHVWEHASST